MTYEVKFQLGDAQYTVRGPDIDGVLALIQGVQRADALDRQWVDPRKDLEPTPWYPDDSGEWVEGHPRDLPPETVMSGWLFDTEREGKNYIGSIGLWHARDLPSKAIVAYKVVKPCA